MQRIRDKGKEKITDEVNLIFLQKKLLESFTFLQDLFAELQQMAAYSPAEFRKKSAAIFILVNGLYTVLEIIQQLGEKIIIAVESDSTLNQNMYAFIISLMPYIKKGHGHTLLHTSDDLVLQDFHRICQFVNEIMKYIEKNNLRKFLQCEITGAPFSSPLERGMRRTKLAALIKTYDETTQPNEIALPIQWLKAFLEINSDLEIDFTDFNDFVAKNYGEVQANQLGIGTYLKSQKKDAQLIFAFATNQPSLFTGLTPDEPSHFDAIPAELIIHILTFLKNPRDIAAFLLANKKLCAIGKDNMLWRPLLRTNEEGGFLAKKELGHIHDQLVKERQRLPKELFHLFRLYNMDRQEEILALELDPEKLGDYLLGCRDESGMMLIDHAIRHAKKTDNFAILNFFYQTLMKSKYYGSDNGRDAYDRTKLHWAVLCFLPRDELIKIIIKAKPESYQICAWYQHGAYGLTTGQWTAYDYAAFVGNVEAVRLFLQCGYFPGYRYNPSILAGFHPIACTWDLTTLHHAVLGNQTAVVSLLLDPRYEHVYRVSHTDRSPNYRECGNLKYDRQNMISQALEEDNALFEAIRSCKDTAILELFIDFINKEEKGKFANLRARINVGFLFLETTINCFHYAAYLGRVDVMQVFLQKTESPWVSIQNYCGATALIFAAAGGHQEAIEFLLNNGADLSITTSSYFWLLRVENKDTLLHIAARRGHIETVRYLLAKIEEINSAAGVVKINPAAKNADGKTWQEVATADVKVAFSIPEPEKKSWMSGWMTSLWKTKEPETKSLEVIGDKRNAGP